MTRRVFIAALFVVLAVSIAGSPLLAQDCPSLVKNALVAAQSACGKLAPGQVCYGAGAVTLTPAANAAMKFASSGDIADLAAAQSLTTNGAKDWGVAMLQTPAGVPVSSQPPLTLVLFGDAQMTNMVKAEAGPTVTLKLKNVAGYAVNVRSGAGTTFPVNGTLDKKAEVTTDGRNASADWFRIQVDGKVSWVHKSLVKVDGDPMTLAVLDNPYTDPMQAFTLTTKPDIGSECGAASAGLLAQLKGQTAVHIQVNGVDLGIKDTTLLLRAQSGGNLEVQVLEGSVDVTASNTPVKADTGASVTVKLGGESGLQPLEGPTVNPPYSFSSVSGAPIDLLPSNSLACVVGVNDSDTQPTIYAGPGTDYRSLFSLKSDTHYDVIGKANDSSNQTWLKLGGRSQAWVPASSVHSLGACGNIADVPAPSVVSSRSNSSAANLVPEGQSVWQANSGLDNVSGTCINPPLALCAHLAAIKPNADGSLTWRGQEPLPYTLSPTGGNTFAYSGRSVLGNGNVHLALTFTSDSTWSMIFTTIFDNDPQCTHTFYYTATRNW
jgi:uncharacterized protein YraI